MGEGGAPLAWSAVAFASSLALIAFFLGRRAPSPGEWSKTTHVMRSALWVYIFRQASLTISQTSVAVADSHHAVLSVSFATISAFFVMVFVVGLDTSEKACRATFSILCICYTVCKILMCNFYIERCKPILCNLRPAPLTHIVILVYSINDRWKRLLFWGPTCQIFGMGVCCVTLCLRFGGRGIDSLGVCRMRLSRGTSIVVILCDIGAEVVLTAGFIWPICVATFEGCRLITFVQLQ